MTECRQQGVGQTAVDNRVKNSANAATTTAFGVVERASRSDAVAGQHNDTGVVDADGLGAALDDRDARSSIPPSLAQFARELTVTHDAGDMVYHGGFDRAWELTITDRPNRTGTFAGDDDGLSITGGTIRGESSKQYGIWGFRAAAAHSASQTVVQWTGMDAGGSAVGRSWVSTNSASRLQIHNPSDPTSATVIASVDNSTGFIFSNTQGNSTANQIALEVKKLNPRNIADDGICFLITVIRADGTVVQCNNISFTAGWRVFNTTAVHLFENNGTINIDRVKFALHQGYESHSSFATQVAAPNHNAAIAWGILSAGTGTNTQTYDGDFDFAGRLKSEDADGVLQLVVGDNDARLPRDPKNATDGQLVGVSGGGACVCQRADGRRGRRR